MWARTRRRPRSRRARDAATEANPTRRVCRGPSTRVEPGPLANAARTGAADWPPPFANEVSLGGRPGVGRVGCAEIPDELDARLVLHDQDRPSRTWASRSRRACRRPGGARQARASPPGSPAPRRPVVEPDTVGLDRRHEAADPDVFARVRTEVAEVDVRRRSLDSPTRGHRTTGCRGPAGAVGARGGPAPGELRRRPSARPCRVRRQHAGEARRRTAGRSPWIGALDDADDRGVRPTARSVDAIPLPVRPPIGTRRRGSGTRRPSIAAA